MKICIIGSGYVGLVSGACFSDLGNTVICVDINKEISALQNKVDDLLKEIYDNLTPWERVQLSRHPKRPHTLDYINHILENFHEIHGDRRFSEDPAMVAGFGYLDGKKIAVVGIENR